MTYGEPRNISLGPYIKVFLLKPWAYNNTDGGQRGSTPPILLKGGRHASKNLIFPPVTEKSVSNLTHFYPSLISAIFFLF